jgi:tetratricopeptide (TPR) repeat protein
VIAPLLEAERLLLHRQVDAAERIYRDVLASDPRNSVAVVGLARVALEREDDRGALDLARRALEIDPDNLAAERMARRLEEVLRYRGESTEPR